MDDLKLNPALLQSYLQRVIPEASLVEGLMQALQDKSSGAHQSYAASISLPL